jgi:hypothetical protein
MVVPATPPHTKPLGEEYVLPTMINFTKNTTTTTVSKDFFVSFLPIVNLFPHILHYSVITNIIYLLPDFHYGYHLFAAAVIGHFDQDWLQTNIRYLLARA